MKRLLQAVSGVLLLLACVIGWRIGQVARVSPPVFEDPPQVASREPLAPAPGHRSPRGAAKDAVVGGNLFEPERGKKDEPVVLDEDGAEKAPLPPPTNVVLNGVLVMRGEPMAIVTDSNAGNKQLTVYVGDNVGDYQVGEITERRVTLLGHGGQQFSLDLAIKKGGGVPRTAARGAASKAAAARSPTAAQRAAAQRAANQAKAQTPAQRAAAARAAAASRNAAAGRKPAASPEQGRINAAQARLDALRRLREAQAPN